MKKVAMWSLPVTAILYVLSAFTVRPSHAQQPPPVKGLPATPAPPAKVPTQEPTARVFDTTGHEVCDAYNDPAAAPGAPAKLELVKSFAEGQTPPSDAVSWERCSQELYRAVRYFDARGRAAQDRIDHAMKDLTPPPPPPTPAAAPEPKK